jgi:hypothetical protein
MARKASKTGPIYQLKITLEGVRPPIWRRLQVRDCTLARLHAIIQTCMDWTNSHMHEFQVDGMHYGEPDPYGEMEFDGNEAQVKLSKLAARGVKKFQYTYDFGDNWLHVVQLEKIVDPEPGATYPRCLTGKRSGPPEDCGGSWGYANLLKILSDPKHKEHEDMSDWVPEDFNPETFDLDYINDELKALA